MNNRERTSIIENFLEAIDKITEFTWEDRDRGIAPINTEEFTDLMRDYFNEQ